MTYMTWDHLLLCLWQMNKVSLPSKSHINSINNTSNLFDYDDTESHVWHLSPLTNYSTLTKNSPLWKTEDSHIQIMSQTILKVRIPLLAPNKRWNTAMSPKGLLAFKVFLIYLPLLKVQWNGKAYRLFCFTHRNRKHKLWNCILRNVFALFYSSSEHCGIKIIFTWETYYSQLIMHSLFDIWSLKWMRLVV